MTAPRTTLQALLSAITALDEVRSDVRSRANWSFAGALGFAAVAGVHADSWVRSCTGRPRCAPRCYSNLAPLVNGGFGNMMWRSYLASTKEVADRTKDIQGYRDTNLAVRVIGRMTVPYERNTAYALLAEEIQVRGAAA